MNVYGAAIVEPHQQILAPSINIDQLTAAHIRVGVAWMPEDARLNSLIHEASTNIVGETANGVSFRHGELYLPLMVCPHLCRANAELYDSNS
jgi:hypothetical protein